MGLGVVGRSSNSGYQLQSSLPIFYSNDVRANSSSATSALYSRACLP